MLPHSRKDAKLDTKSKLYHLNEIADLYNCNNILFFEARKRQDLYVWLSKAPNGPCVKMHLQNCLFSLLSTSLLPPSLRSYVELSELTVGWKKKKSAHNGRTPLHWKRSQRLSPASQFRRNLRRDPRYAINKRDASPHFWGPQGRTEEQTIHRPCDKLHHC